MGGEVDWQLLRRLVFGRRLLPVPEELEGGWVARDCPVCGTIRKFRLEEEESRGAVDLRCAGCGVRIPSSFQEYPRREDDGTIPLEELIARTYRPSPGERMQALDAIAADHLGRQAARSRGFLVAWIAMVCILGAAVGVTRPRHAGPLLPWFATWAAVLIAPMVLLAWARRAIVRRTVTEWVARALDAETLDVEDLGRRLAPHAALRRLDPNRVHDRIVARRARADSAGTDASSV